MCHLAARLPQRRRKCERAALARGRHLRCLASCQIGQNGLQQAREFSEVADVSGIVLTKLDGTAKGGIAVAIMDELKLPVLYIGVGEGIEDLQAFDANAFVDAIF